MHNTDDTARSKAAATLDNAIAARRDADYAIRDAAKQLAALAAYDAELSAKTAAKAAAETRNTFAANAAWLSDDAAKKARAALERVTAAHKTDTMIESALDATTHAHTAKRHALTAANFLF
jgi:hypothetical protein